MAHHVPRAARLGARVLISGTWYYVADAVAYLRARGQPVPDELLAHTSPLTWEHIGFSGDFLWDRAAATAGRRRPLSQGRGRVAA